jgi:AAA+ ATPase superfamily predicted ATPase
MKFYDRKRELDIIRRYTRTAVVGRRRVGKTRLVQEALGRDGLTLYVPEKKEAMVCRDWLEVIRGRGIDVPELVSVKDMLGFLLRGKGPGGLFIDEFQNLARVDPGILSDVQRLLDSHPDRKVVISGSLMGMTKGLIEDYGSPIYGRFDTVIRLRELDFPTVAGMCADMGRSLEEAVELYSVFGGIPKHYETLEKSGLGARAFVEEMFLEDPYPLVEQVRVMLREEFGKEYRTYFSILEAVADSCSGMGEIAGYLGERSTNLSKYIAALEREYEFLGRRANAAGKGRLAYTITENIVRFWFRFVWRFWPFTTGEKPEALRYFRKNFNSFVGERFEEIGRSMFVPPFEADVSGRWWGARREGGERIVEEIDHVVLSRAEGTALFLEFKWKDLGRAECASILKDLERKARLVEWRRDERRDRYGIIARGIEGKRDLRRKGFIAMELHELLPGGRARKGGRKARRRG